MKEIFEQYLTSNNQYIDFNGSEYTLITSDNKVIIVTETPQEMFYFIKGSMNSIQEANSIISDLKEANEILRETNENNIKMYEGMIKERGGETLIEGKKDENGK
jgi:hypothetical protein